MLLILNIGGILWHSKRCVFDNKVQLLCCSIAISSFILPTIVTKGYWVDTNGKRRVANGQGGFLMRQANKNGPFDIAVLHHYAFKSKEELHYKLCVRGNEVKEDGSNKLTFCKSQYYIVHEELQKFVDSAWRQLVRMVPKYRVYENATTTNGKKIKL